ncbi:ArnT family glycosyltransferase [Candidatus Accumulibacter aalborgensis]|nr:glycosyltransferase family 39 protein [Candidatus Accumulibacter aalborgensis]
MSIAQLASASRGTTDERYVRPLLVAALLVAAFLSLWRLDIPLQGSEGRWGAVTMEMLSSGDFFRMTIGGSPYPDKPFGSYWLIAVVSALTGTLNEQTLRLPGALCFVLTTYVVFLLGKRTIGALPGAVAACVFATTFRILFFSRVASADPHTVLGVALAMLLIMEASEDQRWWHLPALGVVVGVTSLMKGLVGVAVPGFAAFLWALAVRGFGWVRPLPTVLGVLALGLTLGVPLAIPWLTRGDTGPLELLWRESVTRGLTPFDHVQPWYFYFWNQFELLAPWSALLPAALALAWLRVREQARARGGFSLRMYDRAEDRRRLFPLFGYLAIFVFFTLSGSRRTYYLLPIAPFFALIVAEALLDSGRGWATWLRKWGLAAVAISGTVSGVAALALGILRLAHPLAAPAALDAFAVLPPEYWQAIPAWLPLVGASIGLGVLLLRRMNDRLRALAPAMALVFVLLVGVLGTMESLRHQARELQRFCATVRQIVPEGEAVEINAQQTDGGAVELTDAARVVFYLGRPAVKPGARATRFRVVNNEWAQAILASEPGRYVVRSIEEQNPAAHNDAKTEARRRVLLERVS